MATTISTPLTTGVLLTQASQNPVLVTPTGSVTTTISVAIDDLVTSSADAITNNGKLRGTSGVLAYGAGSPVSNSGTIVGTALMGVWLVHGGSITNGSAADHTASITGGEWGIDTEDAATIANFGSIAGGIFFVSSSGTLTNGSITDTAALISGRVDAVSIEGGAGPSSISNHGTISGGAYGISGASTTALTISNSGSIIGTSEYGVSDESATTVSNLGVITGANGISVGTGGTITNGSTTDLTATIKGTNGLGIVIGGANAPTHVTNFGQISAVNAVVGAGIEATGLGQVTITNGSSTDTKASITGATFGVSTASPTMLINFGSITGVDAAISVGNGGGTIVNAGTIASAMGAAGIAINLGFSGHLVQEPGSTIIGKVVGGGNSTLELAAASTPGTTSIGSETNLQTITIDANATWTLTGNNNAPDFVDDGTVKIAGGGSLDISSTLEASGTGVFQLMGKASLEIAAISGSGAKIQFLGSSPGNELIIDKGANFGLHVGTTSYAGPLLENFAAGDVIDLKSIASTGLKLAYSAASGDLQVTGSSGSALATLTFQNSSLGAGTFHSASDDKGGTLITHS